MKALPLDPGDYRGTYKLVGGRLSLDFVNTVSYRYPGRPHDWFDRSPNVIDWAVAVDLIGRETASNLDRQLRSAPAHATRALGRIHRQRAVIRRVLAPLSAREKPLPQDVDALNRLLADAARRRRIDPVRLEWTWETPQQLDELTQPVIVDAADLIVDPDVTRLGQCPACGWLFYDSTRGHNRRWCDMADCGSRDKARRYYHRKRAAD